MPAEEHGDQECFLFCMCVSVYMHEFVGLIMFDHDIEV